MTNGHSEAATVRQVTWVSLGVNLLLSALKAAAGIVGNSHAVVADAVHSLSDSTTDIAILIGAGFWGAPADDSHPYGHRRIETIVSIAIGAVLAAAGVGLVLSAVTTMREGHAETPGRIALAAAIASMIVKETLYRWTYRVGKRLHSLSLKANAWHHRSDALSSIPTALAVGMAILSPAWAFLDRVGAVVVSVFVFHAAFKVAWPCLRELVDEGAPGDTTDRIKTIAFSVEGVRQVHRLRARYTGGRLQVDLHVLVDENMSVREGHEIATEVSRRIIAEGPRVLDVVVHMEPFSSDSNHS